jgi:hypothetical protein
MSANLDYLKPCGGQGKISTWAQAQLGMTGNRELRGSAKRNALSTTYRYASMHLHPFIAIMMTIKGGSSLYVCSPADWIR